MNENQIQIQFSEELRGKNALNFWAGVAIIAGVFYAWLKGYFSAFAVDAGITAPPADGYGSGFAAIAIDTVCLIGLAGITAAKFCGRFAAGLAERLGLVTSGLYAWAARERVSAPAPSGEPPPPTDKILDALRSIETRLREQRVDIDAILDNIHGPKTDATQ